MKSKIYIFFLEKKSLISLIKTLFKVFNLGYVDCSFIFLFLQFLSTKMGSLLAEIIEQNLLHKNPAHIRIN